MNASVEYCTCRKGWREWDVDRAGSLYIRAFRECPKGCSWGAAKPRRACACGVEIPKGYQFCSGCSLERERIGRREWKKTRRLGLCPCGAVIQAESKVCDPCNRKASRRKVYGPKAAA